MTYASTNHKFYGLFYVSSYRVFGKYCPTLRLKSFSGVYSIKARQSEGWICVVERMRNSPYIAGGAYAQAIIVK